MVQARPGPSGLSLDDALAKYVGQLGRAQIRIMLLASIVWIPNALLILLMVFHASPSPIKEHWWQCRDAQDSACAEAFKLSDPTTAFCALQRSSWDWTRPRLSIISQFNLICGKAWLSQLSNSAFFVGYLIGSGTMGMLADSKGRKPIVFGCTAWGALFTLAAGLSPNYAAYFIFRLLTGIGAAGQALATYILATESIGPAWRGVAGVGTQLFFIIGEFVLVGVASAFKPWRSLCFACAAINAAALPLWLVIPESPRWLLVRGRKEEATAILERIARGNGTAMPPEPLADVDQPAAGDKPVTMWTMLKDKHVLRRFVVLAYVWLVMCMAYYGISLALGGLPGSIYVTFMIAAAAEFPSSIAAAWMIERYGRHNTMAAGMLLGGAACLACAACPPGTGQAILAAVGKFGCAGAFTVASIFTSELFPTLVRSAVLGAENEAARIGGIAAPFIVLAGVSSGNPELPFIVFGVSALVAGFAIFTLPETLGTALPDTMQDMDNIASIFTTKPWRRGGWRQTAKELFRSRAPVQKQPAAPALAEVAVVTHGGSYHSAAHSGNDQHHPPPAHAGQGEYPAAGEVHEHGADERLQLLHSSTVHSHHTQQQL